MLRINDRIGTVVREYSLVGVGVRVGVRVGTKIFGPMRDQIRSIGPNRSYRSCGNFASFSVDFYVTTSMRRE
jgi:hypothetical protein